jgi:hypothetical protein
MRWIMVAAAVACAGGALAAGGREWVTDIFGRRTAMKLTPAEGAKLASMIRARGFNCPMATTMGVRGPDAYGDVAEVRCGSIAFRITSRGGIPVKIEPWRD